MQQNQPPVLPWRFLGNRIGANRIVGAGAAALHMPTQLPPPPPPPQRAPDNEESRENFLERIIRQYGGVGADAESTTRKRQRDTDEQQQQQLAPAGEDDDVDDKIKRRRSASPPPPPPPPPIATPTSEISRKRKERDSSDESSKRRRSGELAPAQLVTVSDLNVSTVPAAATTSTTTRKRQSSDSVAESSEAHRDKRRSDGMPPPPPPPAPRAAATAVVQFSRKRQPGMLSSTSYMLQLLQADAEEEGERLKRTRVHLRWEYEILNVKFKGDCLGDVRMKRKDEALVFIYENVMQPSKHQRLMHLALKAISYPSFYGAELNMHMVRLLRENNWSEFRTEAIIEAPRRFGKTVGTSMDAAAELVTQPGNATSEYGHDVLCYSNNHRASKMLLLQTYKFVKSLCGEGKFGGRIIGINKNESIRFMTREGYINEMYAYPAKPETLRGTGSKCPTGTVIAEEFAYIPEEVFFGILAPTLTRRNVKFIGITTVNGSDSFVSPLTNAKFPDGRSVFLTLNFQLICTECRAAKREAQCRCLIGDIPHWQSAAQHDKLTIIMERRIGKFLQEIKGLAIDETTSPAFCQVACEFLRTQESVMKIAEIHSDTVFMAVDPACGGRYSKFAIVSAIFVRDPKSGKVLMIVSSLRRRRCRCCRCWFLSVSGLCCCFRLRRRRRARASRKTQTSGAARRTGAS